MAIGCHSFWLHQHRDKVGCAITKQYLAAQRFNYAFSKRPGRFIIGIPNSQRAIGKKHIHHPDCSPTQAADLSRFRSSVPGATNRIINKLVLKSEKQSGLHQSCMEMGNWILSLSLACFLLWSSLADQPIPPALWCDDPSLSGKVGVSDQCQTYNTTAHGKRIKLTLLYESLCPDCQLLIRDVLYPQVWKYGKDFIDLELVPYGNAQHTSGANGTYQITCQHGEVECKLNKLHSCVIHQLEDVSRWFPFINCMEVAISGGQDPDKATKQCYTQMGVKASEQAKITECTQGPQGDQLQKAAADRTDAIVPDKHEFVPWFLVNDVSLRKAQFYQSVLFGALCNWYRGDDTPAGCEGFARATRRNKCLN